MHTSAGSSIATNILYISGSLPNTVHSRVRVFLDRRWSSINLWSSKNEAGENNRKILENINQLPLSFKCVSKNLHKTCTHCNGGEYFNGESNSTDFNVLNAKS